MNPQPENVPQKPQHTSSRRVCEVCGWKGMDSQVLEAPNPFDPSWMIYGCPKCREIGTIRTTCDEPGCWEHDTCGTPAVHGVSSGYRRTCGKHVPKRIDSPEAEDPFFSSATPNPDCSCHACNPKAWWMVVCPKCGNKRCPRAESHQNACTGSNALNQQATPETDANALYEQAGRDLS